MTHFNAFLIYVTLINIEIPIPQNDSVQSTGRFDKSENQKKKIKKWWKSSLGHLLLYLEEIPYVQHGPFDVVTKTTWILKHQNEREKVVLERQNTWKKSTRYALKLGNSQFLDLSTCWRCESWWDLHRGWCRRHHTHHQPPNKRKSDILPQNSLGDSTYKGCKQQLTLGFYSIIRNLKAHGRAPNLQRYGHSPKLKKGEQWELWRNYRYPFISCHMWEKNPEKVTRGPPKTCNWWLKDFAWYVPFKGNGNFLKIL